MNATTAITILMCLDILKANDRIVDYKVQRVTDEGVDYSFQPVHAVEHIYITDFIIEPELD